MLNIKEGFLYEMPFKVGRPGTWKYPAGYRRKGIKNYGPLRAPSEWRRTPGHLPMAMTAERECRFIDLEHQGPWYSRPVTAMSETICRVDP